MVTQVVLTPGEHPGKRAGKAGVVVELRVATEDFVKVMEDQQHGPLRGQHQADHQKWQGEGEPDVKSLADAAEAEQKVVPSQLSRTA